jgi:single-stranded DNA-binding protein
MVEQASIYSGCAFSTRPNFQLRKRTRQITHLLHQKSARAHIAVQATGDYETRTEWHRVYAWSNLSKFARTLQKGQLITLEGTLRYREITEDVEGQPFKHRIAEIHAISMKRLSKIEASDDPSDGAGDE